MPVILWTDALVFLLVAVVLAFALYTRRQPHLRAPWRHVLGSRLASASSVVLLAYVVIGLLDSLHYRVALENASDSTEVHYAVEVLSALDYLLGPLRTRTEKTYSAPFATHLYTRETVRQADGSQIREYPRLAWGGRHLNDPEADFSHDILVRTATAGLQAVLLCGLILVLLGVWLARRSQRTVGRAIGNILAQRTRTPLLIIWMTLCVLVLLFFLALNLATAYHVFGTDKVGQDVFYQTLKSIRTGLVIGTLTTLVMLPFAILMGILAGYARGWIDDLIQYLYTTLNSIPGVLLIAAAILMLQVYVTNHPENFETALERADIRLLFLCIILGITSWTGLCRLLRGESLKLRESEYIKAAVSLGVSHFKVISKHILPNVMHIVVITVVLDFSGLVLAEAVLSYVGVGVDPTMNSWGNMINSARLEMAREPVVWWSLLSAFLFMFTLVLAANLFSDAVRDAFDPRLRQR
ncbi:MAG: ABC transporter permease [Gammaproteobacteria bacterium]|nr:ABC transporter permease [Gammaproteobacteria bacterium]